jgi:hypothetical protein
MRRRSSRPYPTFERLERSLAGRDFRGCPFVNAVAELGEPRHPANAIAVAFKEQRRLWFRDLLMRLHLAMQLALLLDGAIALALVRGDPSVARAARDAARTLVNASRVPRSSSRDH